MMKTRLISILSISMLLVLASCKSDKTGDNGSGDSTSTSGDDMGAPVKGGTRATHSVWENHSLIDAPDSKGKWLASIKFGEDMEWEGDSSVDAAAKRTYLKVTLTDGKTGWVRRDLVEPNSMLGAVLDEAPVYTRPGINNISSDVFSPGDLVVITVDKQDFTQVTGRNNAAGKRKKGWVLGKDVISTESEDVNTAVQWGMARTESDPSKLIKKLNAIIDNPVCQGSDLLDAVQSAKDSISAVLAGVESDIEDGDADGGDEGREGSGSDGDEDMLKITGDGVNIRSAPAVASDNKVAQFNKGTSCTVIEKGKLEAINGKLDYWYKVNCLGSTGWVFGAFTDRAQE